MPEIDPTSGDLTYLKILNSIDQNLGGLKESFSDRGRLIQILYALIGTAKVKTIALYSVASFADLPTPTGPGFGFVQNTQQYYVYSGGWKLIGTVEP